MFFTIYKITNIINGKFYIGMHKTSNLDDGYMGSGKYIKASISKHGIKNFSKDILYIFNNEKEMLEKEKELVVISKETYNLKLGGLGGFDYINRNSLSDYTAAAKKGGKRNAEKFRSGDINSGQFWFTKDGIKKRSEMGHESIRKKYKDGTWIWTGRKHKEESKKKIGSSNSISQQGAKNSQYGTCWITNGIETKKIKKEEIVFWIELGYIKGRNL